MKLSMYQVDAFTSEVFGGNPAAVVPLQSWLPDEVMQSIAIENNLSETAFFIPATGGYDLRWFTPATEVDLCGHATLASAFVLFNLLQHDAKQICFHTRNEGDLGVSLADDGTMALDFPSKPPVEVAKPKGLVEALGAQGLHVGFRSLSPADARRVLPESCALGLSSHEGDAPSRWEECSYRSFGPVFETPSKHGLLTPVGPAGVRASSAQDSVPLWALGGLQPSNCAEVLEAGAAGVMVRGALFDTPQPARATAAFLEAIGGQA